MEKNMFRQLKEKIERYVAEHRLHDAYKAAGSLALNLRCTLGTPQGTSGVNAPADAGAQRRIAAAADLLRRSEENYRYMLDYAVRGAEDPGRAAMAADLSEEILTAVDMLERENMRPDDGSLYFSTLRYEGLQLDSDITALVNRYAAMMAEGGNGTPFDLSFNRMHSEEVRRQLDAREALARRIFNLVWTRFPLSAEDSGALRGAVTSDGPFPPHFRQLMIWALMLGGMRYHDPRRVELLLDAYLADTTDRQQTAALTALMMLLFASRKRTLSRAALTRLAAARERSGWQSDLRSACIELVKPIDTDRITRKIRDEVVPEMLKLKPEIDKKLNQKIENFDPSEMEENPEWQEMLEHSGIADKLKEMSEIQEEGGDVMMGTFAQLKSFGFFHEAANWFLPFYSEHSIFAGDGGKEYHDIAELIGAAPFLCDNDKYSFMLSMRQVPQAQRDLMLQQFKAQGTQIDQLRAASLMTAASDRRALINKHVQNLYRFFSLFRRKGEFRNLFTEGISLVDVRELRDDVLATDNLDAIGEFYFRHGYYAKALATFRIIAEASADAPSVALLQKMGYASQKLGDTEGAVTFYARAEMLGDDSDWTLRRMARCLMLLHRPAEALERLRLLEERHPEHAGTALNIGRCLVELGRYDEAVGEYYKAEYLDEKSGKALRPLAWSLLMNGDLPQSRKYYERVIERLDPVPEDYLNMGHLCLAEGRIREAINFYRLNIASRPRKEEGVEAYLADMKGEMQYLRRLGIDPTLVSLVIDSLLYSAE